MTSAANTVDQYMAELPDERKPAMNKLRDIILKSLPKGFEEVMNYGMMGYVVPHSIYPAGYHCDPKLPLPFMALASQKNSINFYHMGIYAIPELLAWFTAEYPKHVKGKPDMGKSCLRFKKPEQIPYELIGELVKKMSVKQWIDTYESAFRKK
jgi:galactose-1-phosphate uridylyltransferase